MIQHTSTLPMTLIPSYLLGSRGLFLGKLFQIVLFRFLTLKTCFNLNFCLPLPHLIFCKLWYHGLVYFSFNIYHFIKKEVDLIQKAFGGIIARPNEMKS